MKRAVLLLSLCAGAAFAGAAAREAEPTGAGQPAKVLKSVTVETDGRRVLVTLTGDGVLSARDSLLTEPLRLVLDLDGVSNGVRRAERPVASPLANRLRVSQHQPAPAPVTRVVLDLTGPVRYSMRREGTRLSLLIEAGAPSAEAPAPAPSPARPAPVAASTAAQPTAAPASVAPVATPAASPEPGQINLGITPLRVDLGVKAGIETSQPIRITNSGEESVHLRGTVLDWTLTLSGDLAYRRRGEATWGCGTWIQINPVEFALPPGQTQLIRYTVSVPGNATVGGYHCAIAFDMLPPPRTKLDSPMGVVNLIRMLTAIYVRVGTPEIEARIKRLELTRNTSKGAKGWEIVTEFDNPGKTHFRVEGSVELLSGEDKALRKFDYSNFPVLPNTPRISRFDLPEDLPPGVYRLRAVVDVGTREKLAAETKVTVAAR
jgi:hypothetical protein